MSDSFTILNRYYADHDRTWRDNVYVYPVISRRSGGLSIGVNLNPDKACNFDCVYCQVDRTIPPKVRVVNVAQVRAELECTVAAAQSGLLWQDEHFSGVPVSHRRINDIAFSGDGEPTACPQFVDAVRAAADVRAAAGLADMKIVLITDAAFLDRPAVREGLAILDASNGEIWAKLDAGTQEHYQLINRPNVPLTRVLENITAAARVRPLVIQSLWMHVHGAPPPASEIEAFAQRLREILDAGGKIRLVQVYTIVRRTAEDWVTPLSLDQLQSIAATVERATGLPTAIFG